jgi:hypothetical protein
LKGQDQWLTSADSDEFISAGALDLPVANAFVDPLTDYFKTKNLRPDREPMIGIVTVPEAGH